MTPEERVKLKATAKQCGCTTNCKVRSELIADLEAAEARIGELEDDLERTKAAE